MAYAFYPGFIALYIILFFIGYFFDKLLCRLISGKRLCKDGYNILRS